jgi:hypothetical protein
MALLFGYCPARHFMFRETVPVAEAEKLAAARKAEGYEVSVYYPGGR